MKFLKFFTSAAKAAIDTVFYWLAGLKISEISLSSILYVYSYTENRHFHQCIIMGAFVKLFQHCLGNLLATAYLKKILTALINIACFSCIWLIFGDTFFTKVKRNIFICNSAFTNTKNFIQAAITEIFFKRIKRKCPCLIFFFT